MLTAIQQERLRARPCGCGEATLDQIGNVVRVDSCPACLQNGLDFLKDMCYDPREDGKHRERQLDLFPDIPSGLQSLTASWVPGCKKGVGRG